jgi:hypothetical protein
MVFPSGVNAYNSARISPANRIAEWMAIKEIAERPVLAESSLSRNYG